LTEKEFQGIVRIAGKDIKGEYKIAKALAKIKGVGNNLADSICKIAQEKFKITGNEKIGDLDPKQVKELEDIVFNPLKYGLPRWSLDKRSDPGDGKDKHLVMADYDFELMQELSMQKKIKSYRGIRHMFGHKCRGQRTKHSGKTGRKGRALGVVKKKQQPQKKKTAGGKKK